MPSPRFSIAPAAAEMARGYCHGRIRNPSRGILAMGKKIKQQHELIVELERANKEQESENQMLREVNARLRKGWCVKEDAKHGAE